MFVLTLETYSSPEGPRVKSNSPIKAAPKDAYLEAYKRATARRTNSGADQVKPRDSVDTTEAESVDNSADKAQRCRPGRY
ncbi:hypothetical protein CF326_g9687 [Tilletia indica]|nr:hypothetical protein CF326_g9687 [Tilletia indica]